MEVDDADDAHIDELIKRSSLGAPGARELRERTSRAQTEVVHQIIELRARMARPKDSGDAVDAARSLAQLLRRLGYNAQADQVMHEAFTGPETGMAGYLTQVFEHLECAVRADQAMQSPVGVSQTEIHRPAVRESMIFGGRWQLVCDKLPQGERGNHAQIWLAKDITGDHPGDVVVKVAEANDEAARAALTVVVGSALPPHERPYVVEVLGYGYTDGLMWMAMPYYRHGNLLRHFHGQSPQRTVRQVLTVADHVLAALESEPTRAHGDVKATNIVIDRIEPVRRRGVPEFVDLHIRLIDWGTFGQPATALTGSNGTPHWRAPEQRSGALPDARSDLYAVGVLLYWLLSGVMPFQRECGPTFTEEDVDRLHRRGRQPTRLDDIHPGVPSALARFVDQLLDPHPDRRMPSVPVGRVVGVARYKLGRIFAAVERSVRIRRAEIVVPTLHAGGQPPTGATPAPQPGGTPPDSPPFHTGPGRPYNVSPPSRYEHAGTWPPVR
jgi:hypothetical protein